MQSKLKKMNNTLSIIKPGKIVTVEGLTESILKPKLMEMGISLEIIFMSQIYVVQYINQLKTLMVPKHIMSGQVKKHQ